MFSLFYLTDNSNLNPNLLFPSFLYASAFLFSPLHSSRDQYFYYFLPLDLAKNFEFIDVILAFPDPEELLELGL